MNTNNDSKTNFGGGAAEGITCSRGDGNGHTDGGAAAGGRGPSGGGLHSPPEPGTAAPPLDVARPLPHATPLEALRFFMRARGISDGAMLDYLKEEGRIAESVDDLADVPVPVIEGVVDSWVALIQEMIACSEDERAMTYE